MSAIQQNLVVVKPDKRATLPREVPNRDFWIEQRHALLMQLASIERLLGIVNRRCRTCSREEVADR